MTGTIATESPEVAGEPLPLHELFVGLRQAVVLGDRSGAGALFKSLATRAQSPAALELLDFYKKRFPEFTHEGGGRWLSAIDDWEPEPGISVVSCSMDRNENLLRAIPSWLALPVDELVIVDWSSQTPVSEALSGIEDDRIRIIRVEDQKRWMLTFAFNVGLRFARYSRVFKLDADITVSPDFLEQNRFERGQFVRGNWELAVEQSKADQQYVNGSFGAWKEDLKQLGYYNEWIRKYGWDDSDLYYRLQKVLKLEARSLLPDSLEHLPQEAAERLKNQSVIRQSVFGLREPTELYNLENRFLCQRLGSWDGSLLVDYLLEEVGNGLYAARQGSASPPIPADKLLAASAEAIREIFNWSFTDLGFQIDAVDAVWPALAELFQRELGLPLFIAGEGGQFHRAPILDVGDCVDLVAALDKARAVGARILLATGERQFEKFSVGKGDEILLIRLEGAERDAFVRLWDICDAPPQPVVCATPEIASRTVLILSLFDEPNESRRKEYVSCVDRNLSVFDTVVIFYERRSGIMREELLSHHENDGLLDRLVFMEIGHRPTFEEFFSFADTNLQGWIIVVANADIAFDESILQLEHEHLDDNFLVVSRRETIHGSIDGADLIQQDLGGPNTFSSDAWIYLAPRRYLFRAEFGVGTFHCDSYLNHYIGNSGYRIFNPCLSLAAYHVHDPDYNSSAFKGVTQQEEIAERLAFETERNYGVSPLSGVEWCGLDSIVAGTERPLLSWKSFVINIKVERLDESLVPTLISVVYATEFAHRHGDSCQVWLILGADCMNQVEELRDCLMPLLPQCDLRFGAYSAPHVDSHARAEDCAYRELDLEALPGMLLDLSTKHVIAFGENLVYPTDPKGIWLSLIVDTHADDEAVARVLNAMSPELRQVYGSVLSELDDRRLADALPWRQEARLHQVLADTGPTYTESPRVAFVTSVFRGDEFMPGFLSNIAAAVERVDGEAVLVDANSPGSERDLFDQFIASRPQLADRFKYIRLDHDPGIYACWKIGIENSSAPYISNANLDDRRSPLQAVVLADYLDQEADVVAVASAIRAVKQACPWYEAVEAEYWFSEGYPGQLVLDDLYRTDSDGLVVSQNIMHCMPLWRRAIHDRFGYFDEETYGTSADWAFWLSLAKAGEKLALVPEVLSQYLVNLESHNRVNDADGEKERRIIKDFLGVSQSRVVKQ